MPREGDYAPNERIPGTVYQVIRVLGAGGMGTVYEVEDTSVGKRYVVKTLHADLKDRQELAIRIVKEARTLAKLSHANIVEVVTAGATADELRLPYFVMQKLQGHTLRSILAAKGRLPLETAYGIAIDLLDALEHAHAFGVIHRDVKPENIFIHRNVNGTYVTKLLDFGVMRIMSSQVGMTGHRFVGTLRYAPPEQLTGGDITAQTDLYSAALVLFEMIAGRGPFDDEATDRAIAGAHIERTPPRLSMYARVPAALDDLVACALEKDPLDRPQDAFSFASALRDLSRELSEAQRISMTSVQPVTSNVEDTTRAVASPRERSAPTQPSRMRATDARPVPIIATRRKRAGVRVGVAAGIVMACVALSGAVLAILIARTRGNGARESERGFAAEPSSHATEQRGIGNAPVNNSASSDSARATATVSASASASPAAASSAVSPAASAAPSATTRARPGASMTPSRSPTRPPRLKPHNAPSAPPRKVPGPGF